ncbi:MAG: radical SAM protein [Pseudomonadota bacterium]
MAISVIDDNAPASPPLTPRPNPPKVLMIHPKFMGATFWEFKITSQLYGAEYPMPPLGLVTVAAMLPKDWDIRVLDRNVTTVTDADIAGADFIMTGGMLPQRTDILNVIAWAQRLGKKVAVGGPDIMSCPHIYETADFVVVGEAESVIGDLVDAWRRGEDRARFDAEKYSVDVTQSPKPRFELIDQSKYPQFTVQYSRGCPFTCEFCDIIELFGRRPRTKTNEQILAELKAIYDLGYRGHVDFVDDNLIGNKKAVKLFLPELIKWQEEHGWPFDFSTEASLNLADDPELMRLMSQAGFTGVFIGIESPDPDVLVATKKKQNTKRDIAESVHMIYRNGIAIVAGFIVGFDEEKGAVGDGIADLIEEAAIPVAMAGMLYALPNTQLTRRLEKEGRLHPPPDPTVELPTSDQCTQGLNFDTLRPREDILKDYLTVVQRVYEPSAFYRRVRRVADLMRFPASNIDLFRSGFSKNAMFVVRLCWWMGVRAPCAKRHFWRTLLYVAWRDHRALESVFLAIAAYAHIGPFSRTVVQSIEEKIADLKAAEANAEPALAAE